jgi:hypothetical protein
MSSLSTLPKGDSAWLLRKAIERIIEQVSVLETNIGVSTSGNSANTQIIFNDDGTLRGDAGLVYNKTTDALTVAGLVTAGSAAITGDLTVDTTTLFVKSSNDRVGIGTVTPLSKLHIGSGTGLNNLGVGLSLGATANFYEAFDGTKTLIVGTDSSQAGVKVGSLTNHPLYLASNNTAQLEITHPGLFVFNDGAGGTRMTLNSTGLGIGVASPSYKLDVLSTSTISGRFKSTGAINALYLEDTGTTVGSLYIGSAGNEFRVVTGSNVALAIDVNRNTTVGPTTLATTATDGFLYIPGCAGIPTGVPTAKAGRIPMTVDTTNNRFYMYVNSAWRYAALV